MTTAEAIALANEVRSRQPLSKVHGLTLQKRIADGSAALAKSFAGMSTTVAAIADQVATAQARLVNIEHHIFPKGTMQ